MPGVALVYPYFRTRSATEKLFPPLGAACLAGQLRRLGIATTVIDCTFATARGVRQALRSAAADVVGVYSMVSLTREAFRVADMSRALLPNSVLVAGGPLPTLYPERYTTAFDAVFRGEADLSFPAFCRDLLGQGVSRGQLGQLPLGSYTGLFVQNESLSVNNATVHYSEAEIDAFPLPDRSDFDHASYQRAWLASDGTKTASIMTTFGCPFTCDFCSRPVFGSLFRRRSLDAVFAEIEQIRQLGYDQLWIADDNFTLSLPHLEEFCRRIAGSGMGWSCLSRCTGIDEKVARRMKEAGCRRVYLGLESGSEATLRLMNKQAALDEGVRAVHLFHEARIEVAAFFIVGYPGETVSSIEQTFRLALTLPLDEVSFNVPFPLPGSKLFDRVSGIDGARDWTRENEVTFVYRSEFDPRWLRRRIARTMRDFAAHRAAGR